MAEAYGNVVQHWQAYMQAYQIASTDTTVTIRIDAYFHSIGWGYRLSSCIDSHEHCDGQGSGWTGNVSFSSATGETRNGIIATRDFVVARPQGTSGRWVTCEAYVSNTGGYHDGVSSCSCSVWVDPRVYYRPHAPASFAVARSSDSLQRLTWAGNYTGMDGYYPWSGVYVDRATDGGSWQTIATLSWSATNYDDASTSSGHRYDYRLRSYGPGGTSDPTGTVTTYTTPDAYGDVAATKPTTTSVKLAAGSAPRYVTGQVFEASTDGGATWAAATFTNWVCSNPPRGTVVFRVAPTIMSGGTGSKLLQGAWAASNEVATLCAPNAPAVTPVPTVVATGSALSEAWSPNHPDGTAQAKAQVEVTIGDGAATTYDVTGATTSYTLPAAATKSATTVKVRVRTYGDYAAWGEWSAYQVVRVAVAPALALTSPTDGGRLTRLPMEVAWSLTDVTGASSQTLAVTDVAGATVLVREAEPGARSLSLGAVDLRVDNGAKYTFTVSVAAGSGLKATKSATVTVDWDRPSLPEVTVTPGEGLSAVVLVKASATAPVAKTFSVARVDPDGGRTPLADGLAGGQQVIDRLPPLNVPLTYEVTGTAESGSTSTLGVAATMGAPGMALNVGLAAEGSWAAFLDPELSEDVARASTVTHLFDGSDLPQVWSSGEVDCKVSCSFSVTEAEWQALAAILRGHAYGWLRGHDGQRWFGALSGSSSMSCDGWRRASLSLTQCGWREPNGSV